MKHRLIATAVALLAPLLLMVGCTGVDSGERGGYSAAMTEQLNDLITASDVPGVSVALWDAGTVTEYVAGVQSTVTRRPVTPDTQFQIASITKPLAAYAYLRYAQESGLDLDAPVSGLSGESLLDGSDRSQKITSRHLLTHTAGLSNSLLPMDKTVHNEPGTQFGYSGVGYATLTGVMKSVTGTTLDRAAEQTMFARLQMPNTSFRMPFFGGARTASPHVPGATVAGYVFVPFLLLLALVFPAGLLLRLVPALQRFSVTQVFQAAVVLAFGIQLILMGILLPKLIVPLLVAGLVATVLLVIVYRLSGRIWPSYVVAVLVPALLLVLSPVPVPFDVTPPGENAAYSGVSTARDIALFGATLLSDDSTAVAMRNPEVQVSEGAAWGLGIGIEPFESSVVYWHSGINPGSRALLVADPATERVVAVLTNSESGFPLAREIVRTVLGIDGRWSTS